MVLLVADIGGTRARFAIARRSDNHPVLEDVQTLAVADYPDFETACGAYLQSVSPVRPENAALAMATNTTDDIVKLTNNRRAFDREGIERAFGLQSCLFVNDFEAVAHAVANAQPQDFESVTAHGDDVGRHAVVSILGPGTINSVKISVTLYQSR